VEIADAYDADNRKMPITSRRLAFRFVAAVRQANASQNIRAGFGCVHAPGDAPFPK
jgi:hypothetical protein